MVQDPHNLPLADTAREANGEQQDRGRATTAASSVRTMVGGDGDSVVRIRLAARWSEAFAPAPADEPPSFERRTAAVQPRAV
jgi:hypothetical protein